jgi:hypothetical protein
MPKKSKMMGWVVGSFVCSVRFSLSLIVTDLLGDLDVITAASRLSKVCFHATSLLHLLFMLCKHPEYPPHGSRSSSESVSIESDQDNDKEDFDDSRTTELEEWNGFQDTELDGAVHNAELNPESPLDSRPTRVKPSSTFEISIHPDTVLDSDT